MTKTEDEPTNAQLLQQMIAIIAETKKEVESQKEVIQVQSEAIQSLLKERNERNETSGRRGPSIDALEKQIRVFSYRPEEGLTFDNWMERHKEIFENDFSVLEDGDKGRALLRKVDDKVDKQFRNHIRPKSPSELEFNEIVSIMSYLGIRNLSLRRDWICSNSKCLS